MEKRRKGMRRKEKRREEKKLFGCDEFTSRTGFYNLFSTFT